MFTALFQVLGWLQLPPNDILQPPGRGIQQILQVQYTPMKSHLRWHVLYLKLHLPQKLQHPEIFPACVVCLCAVSWQFFMILK